MAKPLVVGVDIRDLKIATTGTKTYLEELCTQFRSMNDDRVRFVFFNNSIPVYTGKNKLLKLVEHVRFQFWKQCVLPAKAAWSGCDIVFCTDYFVPLLRFRFQTVPVFHDAFFFEYPQHYNRIWLWLFKSLALPAAKRSPVVITPSYYAKERVQYYTGIDAQKLRVVYEAPKSLKKNDHPSHPVIRQLLAECEQGLSYLLHVGSFDKRKNLEVLISSFAQLVQSGHKNLRLVLAGKPNPKQFVDASAAVYEQIRQNGLEKLVILPGYVPDGDLPWLYSNALLYVFPSVNEGFGLPVVESFLMQTPVVVANNTCLCEIGGEAVIGFDPSDPDELYRKLKMLIEDPSLQEQLIRKGNERLQLFSWQKAAMQLVDIFEEVHAAHP